MFLRAVIEEGTANSQVEKETREEMKVYGKADNFTQAEEDTRDVTCRLSGATEGRPSLVFHLGPERVLRIQGWSYF